MRCSFYWWAGALLLGYNGVVKMSPTAITDVLLVEPRVFSDERGFLMETYQQRRMAAGGITASFVQDNHSGSEKGVLRGLHYQISSAQGKLVRAIAGEIFDVAVDIRRSSPTFGKWVGQRLSSGNKKQLWVPTGFAHGFYVLSEFAEVAYKATDYYAPEHERCISWNDPDLGIDWPLQGTPVLSAKDAAGALLADAELFA